MSVICIPLTSLTLYDEESQLTSLEILKILTFHSITTKEMVKNSAYTIIKDLSTKFSVSAAVRRLATTILSALDMGISTVSTPIINTSSSSLSTTTSVNGVTSTSSASTTGTNNSTSTHIPVNKKELRNIQINMDNLLGNKYEEDLYIKGLLLTDTITSVTIDRKRELLICYTYEIMDITEQLYTILQNICNTLRDGQGKSRIDIKSLNHANYLDDDEDNDENNKNNENDDNFFGAIVTKGSVITKEKSAAERLREKDNANTSSGGGWFSSLTSWW